MTTLAAVRAPRKATNSFVDSVSGATSAGRRFGGIVSNATIHTVGGDAVSLAGTITALISVVFATILPSAHTSVGVRAEALPRVTASLAAKATSAFASSGTSSCISVGDYADKALDATLPTLAAVTATTTGGTAVTNVEKTPSRGASASGAAVTYNPRGTTSGSSVVKTPYAEHIWVIVTVTEAGT